MRTKFKNVANLLFMVLFASCSREGIVENGETDNGKIVVATEVSVDGVELTTRAASEAGYTTGDGLYDKGDPATVAAFANDGYELAAFYDKRYPSVNLGASHNLTVSVPQTFKAEFRKKGFTIIVNASPTDGGTVTGGGSYNKGATCTLTATPNNGYTFDGWYEGSTKVSTSSSYNFTVSSNRTVTARFGSSEKTFYFAPSYYLPEEPAMIGGRFHLIKQDGNRDYIDIDYPDKAKGEITINSEGTCLYQELLYQPSVQSNSSSGWAASLEGKDLGAERIESLQLNKVLYDKYPSGTLFTPIEGWNQGGSSEICNISIRAARWNGTGWSQDTQGSKVGFDKNNMSEWEITTKARTGEVLTVYASGSNGFHSYPNDTDGWYFNPKGFYDTNHNTYKVNNDASTPNASYTFTVDGNRTIYVDFLYISQ